ncbi:hypothetical protein [Parasitella parasitica]|uniref:hydroxymethylbilane synthase n=1 Tax=Parasitella parasitica TaxID=35722 RepID=A0A0B7NKU0_9FUNG|nr:hypothetical protein [Parasitella parasitica]
MRRHFGQMREEEGIVLLYLALIHRNSEAILKNTRLAKLDDPQSEYAAIVLAVADLVRINLGHRVSQVLPLSDSLYAVSQDASGIECRENDADTRGLLDFLNHHPATDPVISGIPRTARVGHEAIVYRDQYVNVMMGIQNYDSMAGPIHTDDTAILNLKTWTWVSIISLVVSSSTVAATTTPTCQFTFPVMIPNTGGDGGDYNSNNNAIVEFSTNKSPTTTQLTVSITFGILGFLLLTTGAVIFIMRIRRDVDANRIQDGCPAFFYKRH